MHRRTIIVSILTMVLSMFAWVSIAQAATQGTGYGSETDINLFPGNELTPQGNEGAQVFTAEADSTLQSVKVWLSTYESTINVTMTIYDYAESRPPFGPELGTKTITAIEESGEYVFSFSEEIELIAGQRYVIYLTNNQPNTDVSWHYWPADANLGYNAWFIYEGSGGWYPAPEDLAGPWDFSYEVTYYAGPTISDIADRAPIVEDTDTGSISFTVSGSGTLDVQASSSNTDLVPNDPANTVLGGTGSSRTIKIIPLPNQHGDTTITVTVTDEDGQTATDDFLVTVTPVNDPPTVSAIDNLTVNEGSAVPTINFTVFDEESAEGDLTVALSSSNTILVPNDVANLTDGGSGGSRTISITPAAGQTGTSTITVTVSDGDDSDTETFVLTVNAIPTISSISLDDPINEDSSTGAISFTVGDAETAAGSLTVTANSSDETVVPEGEPNIVLGGSDANRTVTVTPAANENGFADITLTVSDGLASSSTTFRVNITAVNDAPTISSIDDVTILEDGVTEALPFTVGDVETPVGTLTISRSSSDTDLIPLENIELGGSGANRTVTVTPLDNQSGSALITLTVSDGATSATESFTVTVTAVNDAPVISAPATASTNEDTATEAISVTATDADHALSALSIVSAVSDTQSLVPNGNINISGSAGSWTVVITPAANQNGSAAITLTVTDGVTPTNHVISLTVNAVDDSPTIGAVAPQTTDEDTPITVAFIVGDIDTALDDLEISGSASNSVPADLLESISVGGTGATRNLTITPKEDQNGSADITVTVSDGTTPVTRSFTLTVDPVNDTPAISDIDNLTANEGSAVPTVNFSVSDVETPAGDLTVTVTSSNTALVPNNEANLTRGGSGGARTLVITPVAGQSGTSTITVTVSDGTASATDTFLLTINGRPTITSIEEQTIDEDTDTGALSFTVGDAETPAASLTVTASSSNLALVPVERITGYDSGGATRTVTVAPAANQHGVADITLTVSDGSAWRTMTFRVNVTSVNDKPTITAIDDLNTLEDGSTGALDFTVGDVETAAGDLTVSRSSSNTDLVPIGNILLGGSDASRTVTVTPQAHQFGTALITLTVSDGIDSVTESFTVTVASVNDAPVISAPATASTNEDTATGEISVTATDVDHPLSGLSISAISDTQSLVQNGSIDLQGSAGSWTLVITPEANEHGPVAITLTVTDGVTPATHVLNLTVNPVDDPPTFLSAVAPQATDEDTPIMVDVTVGDDDTPLADLEVSGSAANPPDLVESIVHSGTGATRTLTITPKENQNGSTEITVTVTDDTTPVTTTFSLDINAVPDAPRLTGLVDTTIDEDEALSLPFTLADPDSDLDTQITFILSSSDQGRVKNGSIVVTGTGGNRTLALTPELNQHGTVQITVEATDHTGLTTTETIDLTITPVNDKPVISAITAQQTREDTDSETINFTISDVETAAESLSVSVSSSDNTIISNIQREGTDENQTLTITPASHKNGAVTITVTVSDGGESTDRTFLFTVIPVNDPPSFVMGAAPTVNEDAGPVTLAGWATSISAGPGESGQLVTFDVSNDNPSLFADPPSVAANGTLTFTTAPNAHGTANVTVTLMDDGGTANGGVDSSDAQDFTITVNPVNDLPVISAIPDQGTEIGVSTGAIPFTVSDAETAAGSLVVTATSSNHELLPDGNITLGGSGANRTIRLTPLPGKAGMTTITLTVDDGTETSEISFDLAANNLYLTNLTTSLGALDPSFSRSTLDYTVRYSSGSSVRITPTSADPTTTITVNGVAVASGTASAPISLASSGGVVDVVVTAPSTGASKTYTIIFQRRSSDISTNARASSISISPGELSPLFNAEFTRYHATVPNNVTSVRVQARAEDPNATVRVSGGGNLAVGDNTVTVTVTAESGATKTYTITVRRLPAALSVSNVQVEADAREATITFRTSEPASASVAFGIESVSERGVSAGSGTNHSASLSGLRPATTYRYRITATTSSGGLAESSGTFTTASERPQGMCPGGETTVDPAGKVTVFCPADEETLETVVDSLPPQQQDRPVSVTSLSAADMADALAKADGGGAPSVVVSTGTEGAVRAAVIDAEAVALAARAGTALTVQSGHGSLSFTPESVAAIAENADDEGRLVIRYTDAGTTTGPSSVSNRRRASAVIDVAVLWVYPDGRSQELAQFRHPISLTMNVDLATVSNPDLLGIYLLAEDEQGNVVDHVYVGGQVNRAEGTVSTELDHLSKYVVLAYDHRFKDVPVGHWADETVHVMAARQVVRGVTADLFAPDAPVTRAQFAAMLVRAFQLERDSALGRVYSDVTAENALAAEIGGAVKAGLMKGYPNGTFGPDALISRQEMALVLTRLLDRYKLRQPVSPEGAARMAALQDVPSIGGWALEAVQVVVDQGLMTGRSGGLFVPEGQTTRAEAVTVLKRLLDLASQRKVDLANR